MTIPVFIQEALSIESVVKAINNGGTSDCTPSELAGAYAFDAACECDDIIAEIESHLDYLNENGAKFDYQDAIDHALDLLELNEDNLKEQK